MTDLRDYYENVYRPARHAGDRHRRSAAEARTQLNNMAKWWRDFGGDGTLSLALFDTLGNGAVTLPMAWLVDHGRAPATANKLRATINALWKDANEQGLVVSLPRNRQYRCERVEPIALTPTQKQAVIAQAARAGDRWLLLVLLLLNSGARITALYEAPTARLDRDRGELLLPARWQKHWRDQRVALWPTTLQLIARLRIVERGLPRVLGDWTCTVNTLRRHFTELVLRPAGIPIDSKHKFHCFRKTFASEVYAIAGIAVAQELLGHSSPTVTQAYLDPHYDSRLRVPDLLPDPLPLAPLAGPQLAMQTA